MATLTERIAKLQAILDTGARTVMVDGLTIAIDPESVRQQLRDLLREQAPRPQCRTIRLSGGWSEENSQG